MKIVPSFINANNHGELASMPGALDGKTMDGSDCVLESFNMFYFHLTTNNGDLLELDPSSSINLRMKTSQGSIQNVCSWHYNGKGWDQLDKPRSVNNQTYNSTTNRSGWINIDKYTPREYMTAKVEYHDKR